MSTPAVALRPLLTRLQERARHLERAAAALRLEVEQVARALDRPVATYTVDGEEVIITEADVAAVRARLVRPHSEGAIRDIALARKIGERQRHLPPEEQERLFWENIEAIRAQAIANGTAIDDPTEAVAGD